jgi:hypothetical protein
MNPRHHIAAHASSSSREDCFRGRGMSNAAAARQFNTTPKTVGFAIWIVRLTVRH